MGSLRTPQRTVGIRKLSRRRNTRNDHHLQGTRHVHGGCHYRRQHHGQLQRFLCRCHDESRARITGSRRRSRQRIDARRIRHVLFICLLWSIAATRIRYYSYYFPRTSRRILVSYRMCGHRSRSFLYGDTEKFRQCTVLAGGWAGNTLTRRCLCYRCLYHWSMDQQYFPR